MIETGVKNQTILIDPAVAAIDQGWTISENSATHEGCFAGVIVCASIVLTPGEWNIEYTVSQHTSGGVYPILAGVNGVNRTSVGNYKDTITVPEDAENYLVKFYSDGNLSINFTAVYPTIELSSNQETVAFDVDNNKYISRHSFSPEMMLRYTNSFFTFKAGTLWKHHTNELRGHYYGVAYGAAISVVVNPEPITNKQWYNVVIDGKGRWYAKSLKTPETDEFPNGMESRIKKNNFKLLNNKLSADILRDMKDPAFAAITDLAERYKKSLFNGRMMEGKTMVAEFCVDGSEDAEISAITVSFCDVK